MVIKVNLATKVQTVHQDQLGLRDTQVKMVETASQVLMDILETKERKDIQVQVDTQVHKDQMEIKEKKVMMDQPVQRAQKGLEDLQGHPTHLQLLQLTEQHILLLHHQLNQKTFMMFFLNHICFEEMIQ